jgi:hypothetical protein
VMMQRDVLILTDWDMRTGRNEDRERKLDQHILTDWDMRTGQCALFCTAETDTPRPPEQETAAGIERIRPDALTTA